MKALKLYLLFFLISALVISCNKNSQNTSDNTQNNSNTQQTISTEVVSISLPTVQCRSCKKNIETALKNQPGIVKTTVDIKNLKADVEIDKNLTSAGKVEELIAKAGYDANGIKADPVAYQNLDDCCKLPKDQKEPAMH
jgi:mercuric ion binding protein